LTSSSWTIKPWFLTEGKTCCYIHHTLLLGFPTGRAFLHHQLGPIKFFWRRCRGGRGLLQGEFRMHILYFVLSFALRYFYLHHFIKNPKKLESLVVVISLLLFHYVVP
jgi:hypothetical protein